jgi:hypothetical protein
MTRLEQELVELAHRMLDALRSTVGGPLEYAASQHTDHPVRERAIEALEKVRPFLGDIGHGVTCKKEDAK